MFRRGRLYRGHKVLPYCARCGTTLSSHEVAQGYKDVKDPSAYVALDLIAEKGTTTRRRILVWTTTPWTLVSNVALAVNPTLEYVELRKRKSETDETVILALSRIPAVLGDDFAGRWETVRSFRGSELVGRSVQAATRLGGVQGRQARGDHRRVLRVRRRRYRRRAHGAPRSVRTITRRDNGMDLRSCNP